MALPDLTRLAIGTHPPVGAPWDVDVAELIAYQQIYQRIGAPEKHPHDALKVYDEMCRASERDATNLDFRAATPPACIVTQEFYLAFGERNDICRDVLMHVFRAYGWTEWLHVVDSNARSSLEINKGMCLNPALEPLAELRALAELHAACYVRDDDGIDVTLSGNSERIVFVERVRNRGSFVADVELLRFEYVTSKLALYVPWDEEELFKNFDWNDDVSRWNPRSLRDASMLFFGQISFQGKGLDKWEMTNLENADQMFLGSRLTANLARWNPVSLRRAYGMFGLCAEFEGNGLNSWRKDWARNLSNSSLMFMGCKRLDISNVANWRLPNNQLNALGMFHGVPISVAEAETLAKSMSINTRKTERIMVEIGTETFRHFSPIYNSSDDPNPVASANKLNADNQWHVAGAIFGHVVDGAYRGNEVIAQLANAVEKWQKEYPA